MDKVTIQNLLRKTNFRDEGPKNLGYLRKDYLLEIWKSIWIKDLLKVILWQRRSWKSYIMRQLISDLITNKWVNPENILYINLELFDYQNLIKTSEDFDKVFKIYQENIFKSWKIYLFVDEIQIVEWWEKYINSLRADYTLDIEIFISWSNSKLLSWELATYLGGRYLSFIVSPFSYEEYLDIHHYSRWYETLTNYLNTWWMPELFNIESEELKEKYILQLNETIILKDIWERYWVRDISTLSAIYMFLMNNIGNLTSLNSLKNKLESEKINISVPTLSNYITYLQETFVFFWVSRYDVRWKRILEGEKKYYLNDFSFLNYSFSGYDDFNWKKLENYVYNYLRRREYSVYVWRFSDKEIDFVAEKKWKKIYVQVAYLLTDKTTAEREYSSLRAIKDSFPKYIISMDLMNYPIDEYWIQHQQAWNLDL